MMKMRNKLEELGKMKGVNQDEKGTSCLKWEPLYFNISISYDRSRGIPEHALQIHTGRGAIHQYQVNSLQIV